MVLIVLSKKKGGIMSVHKNLTDLLKVCSVLPVLAVMPAMADGYEKQDEITLTGDNNVISTGVSWIDASVGGGNTNSVMWVKSGVTTVNPGLKFTNNKADSGVFSTSAKYDSGLVLNKDILFENNIANYDGGAVANFYSMTADGVIFKNNTAQVDNVNDTQPMGGGAIALGAESLTVIKNSLFESNKSEYHGGAIAMRGVSDGNNSDADLDILDSDFIGNVAAQKGGAIYSTFYDSMTEKDSVYIQDSDFEKNTASNGGAVYNEGLPDLAGNKASMKIVDSDFNTNTATEKGGAIYNEGTLVLNDADFENNSAANAGAIYNTGSLSIVGGSFEGNSVTGSAGAIQNSGANSSISVDGTNFIENKAGVSFGALVSGTATQNTTITNSVFKKNSAADAGALGLYSGATLSNVDFIENKAVSAVGDVDGGGAVFLGAASKIEMNNVDFVRNESALRGGAISTRSADVANNSDARLDILNSTFVGNTAATTGGAFDNYLYSSKQDVTAVYMQTVQFTSNSASNGGAIYNHGEADKAGNTASMRLNNVTFVGNAADEKGGAIYNQAGAGITFQGNNTFAKNTAAKQPNDIYNDGLINIESGTTAFAAGVVGDGTFSLAQGATLDLGAAQIRQDIINIDGIVNASVLSERSYAKIVAKSELNVADTAKLNLTVGSVGTYDIFDGRMSGIDIDIDAGAAFKVAETKDGIVVAIKPVDELSNDTGLNMDTAAVVIGLATTSSPTAQRVSLKTQEALKRGDTKQVEQELAKLNPDDKPVSQSVSTSVQNQVMTLATNRMSGTTGTIGRSGGDDANDVAGAWIQGL